MIADEMMKKLQELDHKERAAMTALAVLSRSILPMLKDHNLNNVASELGAKLFEIDAIQGERTNLLTANTEVFLKLLSGLKPPL